MDSKRKKIAPDDYSHARNGAERHLLDCYRHIESKHERQAILFIMSAMSAGGVDEGS